MRRYQFLLRAAALFVIGGAVRWPAHGEEPPPVPPCEGDMVDYEPGPEHCCINADCSWWREKKYLGIAIYYENPHCVDYDFHFAEIGCC